LNKYRLDLQQQLELATRERGVYPSTNKHKGQRVSKMYVRFQVLTAASMKFRIVFWNVLPWIIIIPDDGGSTYL
jgi:hypothetical protein